MKLSQNLLCAAVLSMALLGSTQLSACADEPPVTVKPQPNEVTSQSAADFLRPPGIDRYGPKVDWREVPPWQQTSFFGIRSQGRIFVYVVDCSGSMGYNDRLIRAKRELRRSIMNLRFPQRFHVIFYNDQPLSMPGDTPLAADPASKNQMLRWLSLIDADGATDPRGAMSLALALRPDAVFLLSDGEFPEGTAEAIARKNARKIPINCIDLGGGAGGNQLERIAREAGGQYTMQP